MKRTGLILMALGLPFAAFADETKHAVGITANSFGLGASYTYKLNRSFQVRGIVTGASDKDVSAEYSGLDYKGDLDSSSAGVLLDWYPFRNRVFFSGGLLYSKYSYDASVQSKFGSNVNVGGTSISAGAVDSLDLSVESKAQLSPYIGVGWGNKTRGKRGVAFSAELGLTYLEKPDVKFSASGGTVSQASLNAERKAIERDLGDGLTGYGSVGLSYHF